MAAPQLQEATIKVSDKMILSFNQPLDDSLAIPVTSFSVNYGRIPISSAEYYGTSRIILNLDKAVLAGDKIEINYQPPDDLQLALRGLVPADAAVIAIRRNAVRAFFKVPVKNQIRVDETAWGANSNLGGGKVFVPSPDRPEYEMDDWLQDICGDGSVIIGNPGGGSNNNNTEKANGAITSLKDMVGGSDYADATYLAISLIGGTGSGAKAVLTVSQGAVVNLILSNSGEGYTVDDVLTINDPSIIASNGSGFSVTVAEVYVATTTTTGGTATTGGGLGGQGASLQKIPYPIYDRAGPRAATPDDFILAYGLREAIQLTNIDNADAIEPNTDKMWMAIEDAAALIDNYINQASRAGKLLISSNRRRTCLIIARYYLDTVRRREDVKSDYEMCIKELDKSRTLEDTIRPDLPSWLDPCNPLRGQGVRSWRVPQVYNGVSGKGLSGWWTDSGYSEVDDWRYDRDNAEGNNDDGNYGGSGFNEGRIPDQPVDDGGTNEGGDTP